MGTSGRNIQLHNLGILGALPLLSDSKTFSVSAENPEGKKAGGAREIPEKDNPASNLGKGWKVRPCVTLKSNGIFTIADIKGPGIIQHIWITSHTNTHRSCVLRFYWDNEKEPSVEVPLEDFFANGHGLRYDVNSLMIAVNPNGGLNSYWPMPFKKSCLITIENNYQEDISGFFYQITYSLINEFPDDYAYFHAQWRISKTKIDHPEHTIVDDVKGRGHYAGTFLSWVQFSDGWWGEGEIKFYIDGDKEYPTICGTGTEDYFCGAWCFEKTYNGIYAGYPLWQKEQGKPPKHCLYRWHVLDPIRFENNLKVAIQALGWGTDNKYKPLTDEIASACYWYQTEPHSKFPVLPDFKNRLSV